MGGEDLGQYNSLTDPYLQGYYSKTIVRKHLRNNGLINRRGEIIPEEIWRKRIMTKERMEQASRIVANKIVQQAIEIKNLERAEIRRKLEEVAKKELVRRIRGQSAQNRQLPFLWSANKSHSAERTGSIRTGSRSVSPKNDEYGDVRLLDDNYEYGHRVFIPRPVKTRPALKNRIKRRGQNTRIKSVLVKKEIEPIVVTMIYYGKGIKMVYDTQVFDSKDEITIYQQHCGGENLLVYSGLHEKGETFSFVSRRHKEYPFSLTIYLNGTYDCRISTCCEYRHRLNIPTGKNGRFGFTNVTGDYPCVKCLLSRKTEIKDKKVVTNEREEENIEIITDPVRKDSKDGQDNLKIPINHGEYDDEFEHDEDNEWDDDEDDKSYKWTATVFTDSKKILKPNESEAYVFIQIVGTNGTSGKLILENMLEDKFSSNSKSKFNLATKNIGRPTHLILTFEDEDNCYSWSLNKIELTDISNSKKFIFKLNDNVKRNTPIKIKLDGDEKNENWIVKVYTSDLKNKSMEGTDAKVYISLIGDQSETGVIWLNKNLSKTNNKELFERGQLDEFLIEAPEIGVLEKVRIGHDNSGFGPGWHLNKVELINQADGSFYSFPCSRWLSKDEDDKAIERILIARNEKEESKPESKLIVEVNLHDEPDNEPKISNKKSPSPIEDKKEFILEERTERVQTRSASPIKSPSPTRIKEKSRRLSKNDFIVKIKEDVKEDDLVSVKSEKSNNSNSQKNSSLVPNLSRKLSDQLSDDFSDDSYDFNKSKKNNANSNGLKEIRSDSRQSKSSRNSNSDLKIKISSASPNLIGSKSNKQVSPVPNQQAFDKNDGTEINNSRKSSLQLSERSNHSNNFIFKESNDKSGSDDDEKIRLRSSPTKTKIQSKEEPARSSSRQSKSSNIIELKQKLEEIEEKPVKTEMHQNEKKNNVFNSETDTEGSLFSKD